MTDKKICDCNQGRLPCSCMPVEPGTQETLAAVCTTPAGTEQVSSAWLEQLRAEYRQFHHATKRLGNLLGNLLAVIHRDGGHYQDQHGVEKACEDAKTLVLEEREQLRLLKEAGEQVDDHFTKQMDIATANLEAADGRTQQLYEMLGVTDLVQAKARIEKLLGEEAEAYALADQVRGLQELMANQEPVAVVKGDGSLGAGFPPGTKLYANPVAQAGQVPDIDAMVSRFLSWRLPENFSPDCGISFTRLNHPTSWPVGTNLFTAIQAKAMILHMLAAAPAQGDRHD